MSNSHQKHDPRTWQIEAFGSGAQLEEAMQEIARSLLNAQYKVAHRQLVEQMKVEDWEQIDTEDDILSTTRALFYQGGT